MIVTRDDDGVAIVVLVECKTVLNMKLAEYHDKVSSLALFEVKDLLRLALAKFKEILSLALDEVDEVSSVVSKFKDVSTVILITTAMRFVAAMSVTCRKVVAFFLTEWY